jgi:ERCC4-related helicase
VFQISEQLTFIQERKYQKKLLTILKNIYYHEAQHPALVELDCGLGKRVLSYLIVSRYFPHLKTLILLQATSSLSETADFFRNKYKMEVGYLGSSTPPYKRLSVLKEFRVVLTTPQTLANTIKKSNNPINFDLILINEVDKIIRRTATRRTLIYPYPTILSYFNSWVIGLSGTLRDTHTIITDTARLKPELQTLTENLPDVRIITMDEIMSGDSDLKDHIEYTTLKGFGVEDPRIQSLFSKLDDLIKHYRKKILNEARKEGLINESTKNLALIAGQLPVDSEIKGKYDSLLMMRKYITGMLPVKFKPFLHRFPEIVKEEIEKIPLKSKKIEKIIPLIGDSKRTIIMVSYIYTGEIIQKYLTKAGFKTFFISGMVYDKSKVVNEFRNYNYGSTVLIMTSVGERDLDIPESKKIIVYDTVNTTKTMYQRFKRTRGGEVICMYYKNTSEEEKVNRLYKNIQEKYPWSIKI